MSVPTWERNIDESLKVITFANELRYEIDNLLFRKFWLKNLNNVIRKRYRPKQDELTSYEEYEWFFEKEQNILSTLFANLTMNYLSMNGGHVHDYSRYDFIRWNNVKKSYSEW